MTLPTTFNTVSSPATGAELDANFNAVGALTTVQCVAAGANTIVLTPVPGYPAVTAYGLPYPVRFGFVAAGGSTTSVTAQIGSLAALPLYLTNGTSQAGNGSLLSGIYYEIAYVASYNTGAGGFVLTAPLPSAATPLTIGATQNLLVTNNSGTPNSQVNITAASAVMVNSTGGPYFAKPVSVTVDLTTGHVTSTANGMDGEAQPTSGWVYLYLISNGSAVAGLGSQTSPTSGGPTFPSGYIYSTYVGAMYSDGSTHLLRTRQAGNRAQYVITAAGNTTNMPLIGTGTAGNPTSGPTWVAIALAAYAPLTAGQVFLVASCASANYLIVAPNNSSAYGVATSIVSPPPLVNFSNTGLINVSVCLELESTNVYWANAGANNVLAIQGWVDVWSN